MKFSLNSSIRNKVNHLIIVSIVMLSVFMVGTNFIVINRETIRTSEIMMKKTCSAQALQLNNQFMLVEQSVRNIFDISEEIRPSIEDLKSIEVTNKYIDKFKNIAITIADNTDGAISVYYRINPDINASGLQGFFYVKSPETGFFESTEVTDILEYDVDDVEHVGWYYIPASKGRPVWMEPYYNANIDVQMISYVVPVYDGYKLVGIVGMDVDFERLIKITEDVDIYESSGAVLCSLANSKIYYEHCDAFGGSIPSEVYYRLQEKDSSDSMIFYKNGKDRYGFHYETLDDRMKIIVYAKLSDVYRQARDSIVISAIIFMIVFVLDIFLSIRFSNKITAPIKNISDAAKEYAKGNWDIKIECNTSDEINELSDSITEMAENTKSYIEYIRNMARKDALTGLRNKTDYLMYVDKIKNNAAEGKQYAVVVLDVNNLKYVNDNLGHEKGDELLVLASKYICKVFAHSPIFRVGGDEFVAIIDSGDYENRKGLVEDFRNYMRLTSKSSDWKDICIACGMATIGEDGSSYEEVFKTADKNMYENKAELKDGKNIR